MEFGRRYTASRPGSRPSGAMPNGLSTRRKIRNIYFVLKQLPPMLRGGIPLVTHSVPFKSSASLSCGLGLPSVTFYSYIHVFFPLVFLPSSYSLFVLVLVPRTSATTIASIISPLTDPKGARCPISLLASRAICGLSLLRLSYFIFYASSRFSLLPVPFFICSPLYILVYFYIVHILSFRLPLAPGTLASLSICPTFL